MKQKHLYQLLFAVVIVLGWPPPGHSQTKEHWVAAWGTAQQLVQTGPAAPRPPQTPPPPVNLAVPQAVTNFSNQTIRMIVRASLGGQRVRVRLANAFGNKPVTIGAAHIALRDKDALIAPATDRALSFSGKPGCTIGPGVVLLSDAVNLSVKPLAELAVSLYLPNETGAPTTHLFGLHTAYVSKEGDFTAQTNIADAATSLSYYWLAGVDVLAPAEAALIVALGDSITDGHGSMPDADHNWPSYFARRLQGDKRTAHLGLVNAGIAGNQILRDGGGVLGGMSALARLERDVLTQPGVKYVILMEGINDISARTRANPEAAEVSVITEDLLAGYQQLIARAQLHGLKIIGATLTPFAGAHAYSDKGEAVRQAVNQWIRTSGAFDGVLDFDAATRDPQQPSRFRAAFHAGDWLHPGAAGYEAMAQAIDLKLFAPQAAAARKR